MLSISEVRLCYGEKQTYTKGEAQGMQLYLTLSKFALLKQNHTGLYTVEMTIKN